MVVMTKHPKDVELKREIREMKSLNNTYHHKAPWKKIFISIENHFITFEPLKFNQLLQYILNIQRQ